MNDKSGGSMPKKIFINALKYLREVSIVMLGLTISFSINTCVNNRNERRDISLYLQPIYTEMDRVIAIVEERQPLTERAAEFRLYLLNTERDSWCDERIKEFSDVIGNSVRTVFRLESFEMLHNSGMMRLISDRDLVMLILSKKAFLEYANEFFEKAFQEKLALIHELIRTGDRTQILEYYRNSMLTPFNNAMLSQIKTQAETLKQKLEESRYMR